MVCGGNGVGPRCGWGSDYSFYACVRMTITADARAFEVLQTRGHNCWLLFERFCFGQYSGTCAVTATSSTSLTDSSPLLLYNAHLANTFGKKIANSLAQFHKCQTMAAAMLQNLSCLLTTTASDYCSTGHRGSSTTAERERKYIALRGSI